MIAVIVFVVGIALVNGAVDKNCLKELEKVNGKGLLGAFKPKCNTDGTYQEMQCHEGYCFCVFPKTGEEIRGTRVRFGEPKTCKQTRCFLERHESLKKHMLGQFKPVCKDDGRYDYMQCHETYCYCVFPDTGEEVLGTKLRFKKPKTCELTPCVIGRHSGWKKLKTGMVGVRLPRCDVNNKYDKVQCFEGSCWCADPETGKPIGKVARSIPNC